MALRVGQREINGRTYAVTQLASAAGASEVYRKLHRFFAPILGAIGDATAGKGSWERVAALVADLLANDESWALIRRLLETLTCNGKTGIAGDHEHWDEHLEDLHQVVLLALETNYEKVFRGALGKLPPIEELLKGKLATRPTSSPSKPG